MRLTSILKGGKFGTIATIRGTTRYHISPFEQKALAGVVSKGLPNVVRRFRANAIYWLPTYLVGYLIYIKANAEHDRLQRKQPGQFDHET